MSEFNKSVLTEKGLALLAKGQTGTIINFSRIVIGDGTYTGDLTKLISLQNETKSLPITSIVVDDVTTRLKAQLDNSGVVDGYFIREIGVIADDPDEGEILYAVSNVGDGTADYIPPESSNIVEEMFEFVTKISNAENVTATLDSSLVYASKEEFDTLKVEINRDYASKEDLGAVGNTLDTVSKTLDDTTNDLDPITPAVNGQVLTVITKSTIKKITLKIEADITGGPITIKRNTAAAKPLLTSNSEAVSELLADAMYVDVIEEDTAFLYAPKGGGGIEIPSENSQATNLGTALNDTMYLIVDVTGEGWLNLISQTVDHTAEKYSYEIDGIFKVGSTTSGARLQKTIQVMERFTTRLRVYVSVQSYFNVLWVEGSNYQDGIMKSYAGTNTAPAPGLTKAVVGKGVLISVGDDGQVEDDYKLIVDGVQVYPTTGTAGRFLGIMPLLVGYKTGFEWYGGSRGLVCYQEE